MEYEVEGSRPRGRPKRTGKEVVQKDCQARNLNKEDAMDRGRWKKLIKRTGKEVVQKDFGRRAFSYSSPATWNSIAISIKNCSSLYSFKRHLKSYFIAQLTSN